MSTALWRSSLRIPEERQARWGHWLEPSHNDVQDNDQEDRDGETPQS